MQPIDLVKTSAWRIAFWPLVASRTSRTSWGDPGILRAMTPRTFSSSRIRCDWVWSRPAVSTIRTSTPRARARSQASWATLAGSAPGAPLTMSEPGPLGPDRQLVGGGGAEGVAGGQEDRLPLVLEPLGELGDRGRLARAVDPGDQVDRRLRRRDGQRARPGVGEQGLELALDERDQVLVGRPVGVRLADAVDDLVRGLHAHVGLDQLGFELVEEVLVDLPAEPGADVEQPGRPGEALLESVEEILERHDSVVSGGWEDPPSARRGSGGWLGLRRHESDGPHGRDSPRSTRSQILAASSRRLGRGDRADPSAGAVGGVEVGPGDRGQAHLVGPGSPARPELGVDPGPGHLDRAEAGVGQLAQGRFDRRS